MWTYKPLQAGVSSYLPKLKVFEPTGKDRPSCVMNLDASNFEFANKSPSEVSLTTSPSSDNNLGNGLTATRQSDRKPTLADAQEIRNPNPRSGVSRGGNQGPEPDNIASSSSGSNLHGGMTVQYVKKTAPAVATVNKHGDIRRSQNHAGRTNKPVRPSQQRRRQVRVSKRDGKTAAMAASVHDSAIQNAAKEDALRDKIKHQCDTIDLLIEQIDRAVSDAAAAGVEINPGRPLSADDVSDPDVEGEEEAPYQLPLELTGEHHLEYHLPRPSLRPLVYCFLMYTLWATFVHVLYPLLLLAIPDLGKLSERMEEFRRVRDYNPGPCEVAFGTILPNGRRHLKVCTSSQHIFLGSAFGLVLTLIALFVAREIGLLSLLTWAFRPLGLILQGILDVLQAARRWLEHYLSNSIIQKAFWMLLGSLVTIELFTYWWNSWCDWSEPAGLSDKELIWKLVLEPYLRDYRTGVLQTLAFLQMILSWLPTLVDLLCWVLTVSALRTSATLGLWSVGWYKAHVSYWVSGDVRVTTKEVDRRVATARSTPLLMESRVTEVALTRYRSYPVWFGWFSRLYSVRTDVVDVDVGHLLTCLSHRVDLAQLSEADQVKRIQEAGRNLDLFNVPEALSFTDFHGNAAFIAWEIIRARRGEREDRRPTGF